MGREGKGRDTPPPVLPPSPTAPRPGGRDPVGGREGLRGLARNLALSQSWIHPAQLLARRFISGRRCNRAPFRTAKMAEKRLRNVAERLPTSPKCLEIGLECLQIQKKSPEIHFEPPELHFASPEMNFAPLEMHLSPCQV